MSTQFCIIGDLKKSLNRQGLNDEMIESMNPQLAEYFVRTKKQFPADLECLPREYLNAAAQRKSDERIAALKNLGYHDDIVISDMKLSYGDALIRAKIRCDFKCLPRKGMNTAAAKRFDNHISKYGVEPFPTHRFGSFERTTAADNDVLDEHVQVPRHRRCFKYAIFFVSIIVVFVFYMFQANLFQLFSFPMFGHSINIPSYFASTSVSSYSSGQKSGAVFTTIHHLKKENKNTFIIWEELTIAGIKIFFDALK